MLHRTTVSTTIGTSYPSHFLSFRDFRHTEYMFSLQGARTSCDYPTIAPSKCPRGRPRKPESKLSVDNLRSRRKKRPRGRPRKPKITLELILTPESPPVDRLPVLEHERSKTPVLSRKGRRRKPSYALTYYYALRRAPVPRTRRSANGVRKKDSSDPDDVHTMHENPPVPAHPAASVVPVVHNVSRAEKR